MTGNTIQPSKVRPLVFSLVTLLSGIIIGAAGTLLVVGLPEQEPALPGPEYFSRRVVRHMTRELGLTAQQQESIRSVMETHMQALDAIREEARPQIRQEIETMNDEIMALLDTDQQQQWKENIERWQRWWREARERGRRDGQRRGPGDGRRRFDGDRRDRDRDERDRDDRDDRDRGDRDRFRRGDRPWQDPNSPFSGRRRFRDERGPGRMRPGWPQPDGRRPSDPNRVGGDRPG